MRQMKKWLQYNPARLAWFGLKTDERMHLLLEVDEKLSPDPAEYPVIVQLDRRSRFYLENGHLMLETPY